MLPGVVIVAGGCGFVPHVYDARSFVCDMRVTTLNSEVGVCKVSVKYKKIG